MYPLQYVWRDKRYILFSILVDAILTVPVWHKYCIDFLQS